MRMYAVDEDLARSRKLPTKVSPARSRIVSPGRALLMASWRSEYAQPDPHTRRVAATASSGRRTSAAQAIRNPRANHDTDPEDTGTSGASKGILEKWKPAQPAHAL